MASDDFETVEPRHIDAELEQRGRLVGQRVTIFDGTHVGIGKVRDSRTKPSHYVNLAFLDPQPVKRVDWRGKAAIVVTALLGSIAIVTSARISADLSPYQSAAVLALVFAAFGGLAVAVRDRVEKMVFLTRHGRVPVVQFPGARSRDVAHSNFLQSLVRAIRRAHAERSGDLGTLLCDEMKEHRRLADEGMFTAAQFLSARSLILQAHDQ